MLRFRKIVSDLISRKTEKDMLNFDCCFFQMVIKRTTKVEKIFLYQDSIPQTVHNTIIQEFQQFKDFTRDEQELRKSCNLVAEKLNFDSVQNGNG